MEFWDGLCMNWRHVLHMLHNRFFLLLLWGNILDMELVRF
jgi:hypothetical protein